MLIAARNAMLMGGAKPWTNPYVTDSLVAMWDGEWNAGGGVHDATATVWRDVIGAAEIDLTDCVVSGDNVAVPASATASGACSALAANACSVEALFKTTGSAYVFASVKRRFRLLDGYTNSRLQCFQPVAAGYNSAYQPWQFFVTTRKNYGTPRLVSICGDCPRNPRNTFLDGALPSYTNLGGGYTWDGQSDEFRLTNLTVYCLRIYSRTITAAEVAANYAVDQGRFGLP